jgi:hypothetical protein
MSVRRWDADDAWESDDGQFIHEDEHERAVKAAYQRGFREGYNDHARAAQHWRDTHGAYRQHGEGENP